MSSSGDFFRELFSIFAFLLYWAAINLILTMLGFKVTLDMYSGVFFLAAYFCVEVLARQRKIIRLLEREQ